jgi:hypothetical protein
MEASLRHLLKLNGHDVSIFDDAKQTQQDRTISSLFEQMREELDAALSKAITTDIENVFLIRPGPHIRHGVAHGLLHDGAPYSPDAVSKRPLPGAEPALMRPQRMRRTAP